MRLATLRLEAHHKTLEILLFAEQITQAIGFCTLKQRTDKNPIHPAGRSNVSVIPLIAKSLLKVISACPIRQTHQLD